MKSRSLVSRSWAVWLFAGIYFGCYLPYSALTKALSGGAYPGSGGGVPGATLLPIANLTATATLGIFLLATGWWRHASRLPIFGLKLPWPRRWTAISGLCTAVILTTTTLAYTFEGVSIVFVMLLMRGGVLMIAPAIDRLSGRTARWYSWLGLALALSALVVAFSERGGYSISLGCAINIAFYLSAYFIRLRIMSRFAKSKDAEGTLRYFVEEQLMGAPASVLVLIAFALIGEGELMQNVRRGFTAHLGSGLVLETVIVGVLSQGVILFGSLVFLDHRENTYSVPVNRSVSTLAGVLASFGLAALYGTDPPSAYKLTGAGLVLAAILVLGFAPRFFPEREPGGAKGKTS